MLPRRLPPPRRWSPLTALLALLALVAAGCQGDDIAVHQVAKPQAKFRLLAVMLPHEDQWWFFKLEGPIEKVDAHAAEFDQFIQSVRFKQDDKPVTWTLPEGWHEEAGEGLRK